MMGQYLQKEVKVLMKVYAKVAYEARAKKANKR